MPRKPDISNKERYNDAFPSMLRKLMEINGTTQEEMKTVLGLMNRQSVTGYVDGSTQPTPEKIIAASKYFGVSADYLLGLSEHPSIEGGRREAAEYTGLSEAAVEALHEIKGHFEVGDFDVDGSYIKDEKESLQEADKLMGVASALIASESFYMVLSFLDVVGYKVEGLKRELERPHDSENWDRLHDAETELRHAVFDCVECFQDSLDEMYGVRDCKKDAHRAIDAILKSMEKERR